jgi:hypothetical protein
MIKRGHVLAAVIMSISVSVLSGCQGSSTKDVSTVSEPVKNVEAVSTNSYKNTINEFNYVVDRGASTEDAIRFIDKNISKVTKEDASEMMVKLEELQGKEKLKLEGMYSVETIQEKFVKEYNMKDGLNQISSIKDEDLKKLLTETENSGFKVETAEGFYFPVIDYSLYKKCSSYVTEDIASYINLMSVESDNAAAKDAGLMISWTEVFKRAQSQEKFLNEYGNSRKTEDVKKLYQGYLTFILFGANNTPLFAYDSKVMVPDAQKAYSDFLSNSKDSSLYKTVSDYFEIIKKNNYKLNDEVDKFRKSIIKTE